VAGRGGRDAVGDPLATHAGRDAFPGPTQPGAGRDAPAAPFAIRACWRRNAGRHWQRNRSRQRRSQPSSRPWPKRRPKTPPPDALAAARVTRGGHSAADGPSQHQPWLPARRKCRAERFASTISQHTVAVALETQRATAWTTTTAGSVSRATGGRVMTDVDPANCSAACIASRWLQPGLVLRRPVGPAAVAPRYLGRCQRVGVSLGAAWAWTTRRLAAPLPGAIRCQWRRRYVSSRRGLRRERRGPSRPARVWGGTGKGVSAAWVRGGRRRRLCPRVGTAGVFLARPLASSPFRSRKSKLIEARSERRG